MIDRRPDFTRAAAQLVSVVEQIRDDQWDLPGLGEWTVRELVGHALRGVQTTAAYLDVPAEVATLGSPGEYFRRALATPDLHAVVARRGREAGVALGDDPLATVRSEVDTAVARVAAADPGDIMTVVGGTIALADYLPTRIFEIVVHTDDLCRALGLHSPATPELVTQAIGTALDTRSPEFALDVLRQVTGRAGEPGPFG